MNAYAGVHTVMAEKPGRIQAVDTPVNVYDIANDPQNLLCSSGSALGVFAVLMRVKHGMTV
jgi:hypothetical protein